MMTPFTRAYFKYYGLCILACLFNVLVNYIVSFTGTHIVGEFYIDYTGPMLTLSILCILPAWAESARES